MRKLLITVLSLATFVAAQGRPQQDKSKRPSPPAHARCTLPGGDTITVDYSAPSMRGRKIYGGLVPYNEVWRTGANEATTFVTTTDLNAGGITIPKGSYTLFTIPGEKSWKLIINKQTGQWGTDYNAAQDLARIEMKTEPIEIPLEKFHISLMNPPDDNSVCTLRLDWEKTRAYLDFAKEK